jgi:hypothetical protein
MMEAAGLARRYSVAFPHRAGSFVLFGRLKEPHRRTPGSEAVRRLLLIGHHHAEVDGLGETLPRGAPSP